MRIIFEFTRLFALVAVFGLMAANSGCAKPENGDGSTPPSDLGVEAGSTTGGGAEIPDVGEGEAPAETEGDAAPAEAAPAEAAPAEAAPAEAAPAEAAPAEAAPAEGKAAEGKAAAKTE